MAKILERERTVHGHRVRFLQAGAGPPIVLIHGITSSTDTWVPAMAAAAGDRTLIAPDLLGHGDSATPRGDYSLGAHASGVRDLLSLLGHEHATVVGHSLGGGIAMVFSYQFPERTDRLVLVSSGGLGREVHPLLRAAALPGADYVLPVITSNRVLGAGRGIGSVLRRLRLAPGGDLALLAEGFGSLDNRGSREAFLHTVRAVIDSRGQRVSAYDRMSLATLMPTQIVWGERDSIIPLDHGKAAHAAMPHSRFEVFPDAGHLPHHADPERFADLLARFCRETAPANITAADLPPLLAGG